MKKVENGPLGRVIRTFGYILVLVSSVYMLFYLVSSMNIPFLNKFLPDIEKFLRTIYDYQNFNLITSIFIMGILILLWTLSKSFIVRIFSTVLIVITVLDMSNTNFNLLIKDPAFTLIPAKYINKINPLLNKTIYSHPNLPKALNILAPFLLYIVFASKKPERISTEALSGGLLILTISIFLIYLPAIASSDIFTYSWYSLVITILMALSYVIIIIGSLFGILGIFKK